jgi:dipeptidyl aminopeptidase/acylaminoacyl peptidase
MQDDVTDGTKYLIDQGIADAKRVCIVGWSYGAYAALDGASKEPSLYKCAVGINGVYDLVTLLSDLRGLPAYDYWKHTMGSLGSDHDRLIAVSPALQASAIAAPVLLIGDKQDTIAPYRQSEIMSSALSKAGKSVRLVTTEHGDHSELVDENRVKLLTELEGFLAQNLKN